MRVSSSRRYFLPYRLSCRPTTIRSFIQVSRAQSRHAAPGATASIVPVISSAARTSVLADKSARIRCSSDGSTPRSRSLRLLGRDSGFVLPAIFPGTRLQLASGVCARRDQFVIEYVGEVVDREQFAERTAEYADEGIEHYYFMTVNGEQVQQMLPSTNLLALADCRCNEKGKPGSLHQSQLQSELCDAKVDRWRPRPHRHLYQKARQRWHRADL